MASTTELVHGHDGTPSGGRVEVPAHPRLDLGTDDFTLLARFRTDLELSPDRIGSAVCVGATVLRVDTGETRLRKLLVAFPVQGTD